MTNRTVSSRLCVQILFPTALSLAIGIGIGWQMRTLSANAEESATTIAKTEIGRFYDALSENGTLKDVLGDAFQLIRTDGKRYDRDAYLANASSVDDYTLSDVEAFESDGVLTATFKVSLTGKVAGIERETDALPRMVVFSKVGGDWKMQAYANLGQGLATGIDDQAKAAVQTWINTAASGDKAAIRNLLAPEFQIVRSDGAAYDAEEYLAHDIPKIDKVFGITDIVATAYGDDMVVRYVLDLKGKVAGGEVERTAPRMTVFRRHGDTWLVVAHSNFAQIEN